MKRAYALMGSALFMVIGPGIVAGYVPWRISGWQFHDPFFQFEGFRVIGVLLILLGLPVLFDSFARFAIQGFGTPLPVIPPTHLVVTGWYRYVRNPMYVAVVSVITGQALLFGSVPLLEYAVIVWLFFHTFVFVYEEPKLRNTFGEPYDTFRKNVPRWIPRLRPWTQK
jgi:protein-S-isoprenylcysteine O-methyltransferase Ste14